MSSTAAIDRRASPARLYDGLIASDAIVAKAVGLSEVARMAKLEQRLREYLEAEWNSRAKKAAKLAGEMAAKGKSSAKIAEAIGRIMRPWARAIQPRFNREIAEIYRLARIAGHKKATRQTKASLAFDTPNATEITKAAGKSGELLPSFDLVDDATIGAMKGQNTLWIGEHYDKNVVAAINETTRTAVETGTIGTQAGKLMSERVRDTLAHVTTPKGFKGTDKQYFEGLVANAATNARAQGQIRSFTSIGVTYYEIVNPGDDRTCPVCDTMDGKIFSIQHAVTQIVNDLKANTPDEVRASHPWPSPKLLNGDPKKGVEGITQKGPQGPADAKKLADMGFALPPYHFRCRCAVDVSEESTTYEELSDPIDIDARINQIGQAAGVATNMIPPVTIPIPVMPETPVTPTKGYDHNAMKSALNEKPAGSRMYGAAANQYSEAQQIAIRRELNALCAETGMVTQDVTQARSMAAEYVFRNKSKMGNAAGIHHWTGRMTISKDVNAGAKRFLKQKAGAELTEKTIKDARDFKVLVHEAVHGHSPMVASAYKGVGKTIEEATTEVASRAIMRQRFGIDLNPKTSKFRVFGAYQEWIDQVTGAIQKSATFVAEFETLGVAAATEVEALKALEVASIKMRQEATKVFDHPNQYARHFVENVKLPGRMTAGMKGKRLKEVEENFRNVLRGALDIH